MSSTAPALVRRVYLAPATTGAHPVRHLVRLRPAHFCAACTRTATYPWPAAGCTTPGKYTQAYLVALDLGAVLGDFLGVDLLGLERMLRCF